MFKIKEIIKNVGGLTKAAKLFNVPVSTIQYWQKKDFIPIWRRDMVKKTLNDFYEGDNNGRANL